MKIVLCGAAIALLSIVLFSSCQKEINGNLSTTEDTVRVKSIVYLDTTKVPGMDTVYKTFYTYDNTGRVVNSFSAEYSSGTPATSFTYDFFYTGSSVHPYKQIITQGGIAPYHSFLTYNSADFVVKDSSFWIVTPSVVSLQTYGTTPSGGFVMVFKEKDLSNGAITDRDSITYRRTITAGNILSGVDSSHHPTLGLSTVNYQYSYDNRSNPFHSIAATYPYLGTYFFTGDGFILPIGKNNAISFSETYFDGVTTDQVSGTINYSYRTDGFPLTGRITGHPDVNKVIFDYYN